jgi:hypothetical protein
MGSRAGDDRPATARVRTDPDRRWGGPSAGDSAGLEARGDEGYATRRPRVFYDWADIVEKMTATGTVGPRRVCVALRQLKRRGGLVFVTGPDGPAADRAMQRLFGASGADRRRLLVSTDDGETTIAGDVEDVRVVDRPTGDRPGAAGAGLQSLRAELIDAIAEFESEADGLAPGELRVVIDAVDPMVTAWGVERVDRFLRTVAALARGVRGLVGVRLRDPDALQVDGGAGPDVEDAPDRRGGRARRAHPDPTVPADGDWSGDGDAVDEGVRGTEGQSDSDGAPDRERERDGDRAIGRGTVGHRGSADDRRGVGRRGDVDSRRSVGRRTPPGSRRPTGRNWSLDLPVPDRFRQTTDAWIEVCDCDGTGDADAGGDGEDERDCQSGPAHRWHFPDVGTSAWVSL